MRLRGKILAVALGVGLFGSMAHAASNTEYLAIRAKTTLAPLDTNAQLASQLVDRSNQNVEFEGVVSGIFSIDGASIFVLRVGNNQTVTISSVKKDPDIVIGNTVRVMAHVPIGSMVLESLSMTKAQTTVAEAGIIGAQTSLMTRQVAPAEEKPQTDPGSPIVVQTTQAGFPEIAQVPVENRAPDVVLPQKRPGLGFDYASGTGLARNPEVVSVYANRIKAINGRLEDGLAQKIAFHILDKSERYGVDPRITLALVARESRFDPQAVSCVGAQGLGQLMPGTAAGLGVRNPFDVEQNLDGTVRYLSEQLREFGRLSLALAAYNAGPGAVKRYGGIPPFRETQNYVRIIWNSYSEFAGIDPSTGDLVASQ